MGTQWLRVTEEGSKRASAPNTSVEDYRNWLPPLSQPGTMKPTVPIPLPLNPSKNLSPPQLSGFTPVYLMRLPHNPTQASLCVCRQSSFQHPVLAKCTQSYNLALRPWPSLQEHNYPFLSPHYPEPVLCNFPVYVFFLPDYASLIAQLNFYPSSPAR